MYIFVYATSKTEIADGAACWQFSICRWVVQSSYAHCCFPSFQLSYAIWHPCGQCNDNNFLQTSCANGPTLLLIYNMTTTHFCLTVGLLCNTASRRSPDVASLTQWMFSINKNLPKLLNKYPRTFKELINWMLWQYAYSHK